MIAKALKNPELKNKFRVGQKVRVPRNVWTQCTHKMVNLPRVEHEIAEVGDMMVVHGKNHLCRFGIRLGDGTSSLFKNAVIWEEWMLEKIDVISDSAGLETCALVNDETSLPPHP